jgi:hypothetical protein
MNKALKGTNMTKIQVYDPALCCSTGICGVEVDQEKVALAGRYPRRAELAKWAKIRLAVTDTQQGGCCSGNRSEPCC